MATKVDLFTLLRTFSHKTYSASINTETFITFMEKNVQRENAAELNIDDWKIDTRGKILRGISELASQNKISVEWVENTQMITINSFFADLIGKAYASGSDAGLQPFPDEKILRCKIPEEQIRTISVESGLTNFLAEKHITPNQIIRIVFSDNYGRAFALESQFPRRILEIAVAKIVEGIRKNHEMDYYSQKLMSHFRGQELRVRDFINILMVRPLEAVNAIEESNDFTYSTWLFLCPLIKKHIEEIIVRTNAFNPEQISQVQAISIILTMNNFYQIQAMNRRNTELSLNMVNERLIEPPYIYSLSSILQFKNQVGIPLTQNYTELELENYLKEKMTVVGDDLPELFRFRTKDGTEWFVKKERVWPLCSNLLAEVQPQVKNEIRQRWQKMLRDYRQEKAMEKNEAFEDLVIRYCNFYSPQLIPVIQDKRTAVLQDEVLGGQQGASETAPSLPNEKRARNEEKFFDLDRPIPLSKLLCLQRDALLYDCKLSLPFWYSIKPIVQIVRFFKYGLKKVSGSEDPQHKTGQNKKADAEKANAANENLRANFESLVKTFVPASGDMDSYLETLESRWNQLLDKAARQKLLADVHAIIKAHMNQVLKFQKPYSLTEQMLDENAEHIIRMNFALSKINNKKALRTYIKVYVASFILNQKR